MFKAIQSIVLITVVAATTQHYRGYYQYREEKNVPIMKRGVSNPTSDFIRFDGPTSRQGVDVSQPVITDECRQLGYCLTVPNYPTDLVEKLIDEYPDKAVFRKDTPDNEDVQVVQRLGGTDTEPSLELCSFYIQTQSPQAGQDKDNTWYNIINTPNKQVQTFTSEICTTPRSTCQHIEPVPGYVAECQQKYVFRTAAVLGENKQIVFKDIRFPSCCSCRLRQV